MITLHHYSACLLHVTHVVQCPVLPSVTNGKISYSDPSLSVNTLANYSCDLGYSLNSRKKSRICQANGTWSGPTDLSCEGM